MYTYDSSVHLVSEIDGVRVLSATQHELIQKVPDVVQKIFRINSTDPGSFLLEASKQFQVKQYIFFKWLFNNSMFIYRKEVIELTNIFVW